MKLLDSMDITVLRKGDSRVVRGKVVESEPSEFKIRGSLQPETNLRLIREIYGTRVEAAIKIYSKDRLRTFESDGAADFIEYNGKSYEVSEVRMYETLIPHYKSIAILVKDER